MADDPSLDHLIAARHPCIVISTFEEAFVLDLINRAITDLDIDFWIWTINKGLHVGWLEGPEGDKDTEHPAAAMHSLSRKLGKTRGVTVLIDLIGHLEDARTLRLLRDLIEQHRANGGTVILVDHLTDLPSVIATYAARYEVALPTELLRKGRFDEIFFVDLPGRAARTQIFKIHLAKRKRDPAKFDLKVLTQATDGYTGAEIE